MVRSCVGNTFISTTLSLPPAGILLVTKIKGVYELLQPLLSTGSKRLIQTLMLKKDVEVSIYKALYVQLIQEP